MSGSADKNAEATVHMKKHKMGRSSRERRIPVVLEAIVLNSQPPAAIASEISAPAIECGANTANKSNPRTAQPWASR
jgi:hypothetical protein